MMSMRLLPALLVLPALPAVPLAQSPAAAISPKPRISAPKNGRSFSIILKPLYAGGLWLPVIMMPPSQASS